MSDAQVDAIVRWLRAFRWWPQVWAALAAADRS